MPDAHRAAPTARCSRASEIIPVAERLGLVRLLDHRVLELVVAEMAASPDAAAPASTSRRPRPPIRTGGRALGALLRANSGVAERLIVEITETAAIHDIDDTRGFVTRVKDLGCRIAIDDFGAGYTSFRNLRKLGVDIVKIDGAFVQNLTRSDGRSRLRAHADRSRPPARPQDRRRMGAGRGSRRDAARMGLRLSAGPPDRARLAGAAVEHGG